MIRNGWRLLTGDFRPRCFREDDEAWYRFPMVSENFGTPVGLKRLRQLRSSSPRLRAVAAKEFAAKVAEFLPPNAWLSYMPSSTRRSSQSDNDSIEHLFLSALRASRPDVTTVEPLLRTSPAPSVHDERIHDVALLRSTLQAASVMIDTETLYVADDLVCSGATYAAFRAALAHLWPNVRTVLLTLVFTPRKPRLFE